jgi:hypothetical protein
MKLARKSWLVDCGPRPLCKLPPFLYPPEVERASSAQGPTEMPLNAVHEPSKKPWLYRVLRRGEFPWELRNPPETKDLSKEAFLDLLVSAVALGNNPEHTSPFLHTTTSLGRATMLLQERRHLYSNWLVRFPMVIEGIDIVDLSTVHGMQIYLQEKSSDSALLQSCVGIVRSYAEKDREVVVLRRPPLDRIDVWDQTERAWIPASRCRAAYAAISQPLQSATSQSLKVSR